MAYVPGSIGRTMQGELFMVDADCVAHNEGTPEFADMWSVFIANKRHILQQLYSMVYVNYWDSTYKQVLYGRPHLLNDCELCTHMFNHVLSDLYQHVRCNRDRIQYVRDYIIAWAPHVAKLNPNEVWVSDLVNFVTSDIIFRECK